MIKEVVSTFTEKTSFLKGLHIYWRHILEDLTDSRLPTLSKDPLIRLFSEEVDLYRNRNRNRYSTIYNGNVYSTEDSSPIYHHTSFPAGHTILPRLKVSYQGIWPERSLPFFLVSPSELKKF